MSLSYFTTYNTLLDICSHRYRGGIAMKTHGHYQTLSAIKQMRKLVDYMVGGKVKSRKVRRDFFFRCYPHTVSSFGISLTCYPRTYHFLFALYSFTNLLSICYDKLIFDIFTYTLYVKIDFFTQHFNMYT